MPDHITPLLLTAAFALMWGFVAATYLADSLREVRKERGRHQGPHFQATAGGKHRSTQKT